MDDTSIVFDTDGRRPYTFRTVLIDKYEVVSLPVQTTVRPALNAPSQPGEPGPLSYNDLFAISMRGKSLEITTLNGSIFKGELVSVGPDVARLNVEGMEVPIFRKMVARITISK
jgi:hypothetical protein